MQHYHGKLALFPGERDNRVELHKALRAEAILEHSRLSISNSEQAASPGLMNHLDRIPLSTLPIGTRPYAYWWLFWRWILVPLMCVWHLVAASSDLPLGRSSCLFSGQCLDPQPSVLIIWLGEPGKFILAMNDLGCKPNFWELFGWTQFISSACVWACFMLWLNYQPWCNATMFV